MALDNILLKISAKNFRLPQISNNLEAKLIKFEYLDGFISYASNDVPDP